MPCDNDQDLLPLISSIPGPRGPAGPTGATAAAPTAGINAFTTLTASFVMPALGVSVVLTVAASGWMAVGQTIFIETAGQFVVDAVLSPTSVRVLRAAFSDNPATSTVIASGSKVSPSGSAFIAQSIVDDYNTRIQALETTPGGNKNYYATSDPAGAGLNVGDILFRTDQGYKMYRWTGSAWVAANKVLELADFGTGIKPVRTVSVLPGSGAIGDFVILSTDNKIYRGTGSGWTKAVATGELVGEIDGTMVVDGTIIAQKIGAGAVTADKVGANQIITTAANITQAIIDDSHIGNLSAGKITAGDMQAVNIGYSGRIFHPLGYVLDGTAATAAATVSAGVVTSVTVSTVGAGYSNTPAVILSGGGGTGATAVAEIAVGTVVRVRITNQGTGYTSAPTVTIGRNYAYRYFRSVEFATPASLASKTFAVGNCLTDGGYVHATPAIAYGPLHGSWTAGCATVCPSSLDAEGRVRIMVQGRLLGHTGNALIYCSVGGGAMAKLAAAASSDTWGTVINTTRLVTMSSLSQDLKVYVAPADGNGAIATSTSCSAVEIDLTIFNW